MNNKPFSILSLCTRAGKLVSGEESCEKALKSETAYLVLISEDASDNTKKKFINKSFYYKVPVFVWGNRDALSHALGKQNRVTIVITDKNFAEMLIKLIDVKEEQIEVE